METVTVTTRCFEVIQH